MESEALLLWLVNIYSTKSINYFQLQIDELYPNKDPVILATSNDSQGPPIWSLQTPLDAM